MPKTKADAAGGTTQSLQDRLFLQVCTSLRDQLCEIEDVIQRRTIQFDDEASPEEARLQRAARDHIIGLLQTTHTLNDLQIRAAEDGA